ncbi:CehA/McbA family metallohydrolase [Haloarcula nitratireducens]|uniref:CehA/McbA family metallohydrolase n=1 Tax=Haloarcula nitratireducens TaxID=2487749 RepID=A0AAW4PG38_9EURY|nr:CehA/McbA family metallohydrolase [Halomicroarcula nitratireducens]MBX0296202.1 CehA/McbA family metallohydrolase [Halomicroarcula nitratireducens]
MYKLDLHAHTRFFHWNEGEPTRFDPVGASLLGGVARRRDLDGVALTNHDYYRPYDHDSSLATIPGIEVSTTRGHVLVVGPDPPADTEPEELTPEAVVEMAHDRGCAAIMAHPYRNSTVSEGDAELDAVEINGKHPQRQSRVRKLAESLDLPLVGGSDAHYPFEVGRAHTMVDAEEPTPEAVVEAIRDGRVGPRVDDRLSNRVLHEVYQRVHEHKGHV